jgi:carbonic anhydrase
MDIIYRYDPYAEIVPRKCQDPDAAIRDLQEGHGRYRTIVKRIASEIAGGSLQEPILITSDPLSLGIAAIGAPIQVPHALVLGCSDARVPIERIFDQPPNALFVIRVAGNVLGTECLGSIDYAVQHLKQSLQLLVVLGHSGCGAVSAAVDTYLSPHDYPEIGFTHSLRSLVDRLQIAVRGAAKALERVCGASVIEHPGYRVALVEATVYLNAALTAFDVRQAIAAFNATSVRVVYSVFNLDHHNVNALPHADYDVKETTFGHVPSTPEEFTDLGEQLVKAVLARGLLPRPKRRAGSSRRLR